MTEKLGCYVYERKKGSFEYHKDPIIGGSQAGIVLGVNKYTSPLELYMQKTGLINRPKVDNKFVEWGIRLEPLVADKFAEDNKDYIVEEVEEILQHKENKFMVANIDRLLIDTENSKRGILEIKTASEWKKDAWDEEIPESYYAQIQHYMYVLGCSYGYFAVLIGGNTYKSVRVERDEDYILDLIEKEREFIKAVKEKDEDLLKEKFNGESGELDFLDEVDLLDDDEIEDFIEGDESIDIKIDKLKSIKKEIKKLKKSKNKLKSDIKLSMKKSSKLVTDHFIVSNKECVRKGGIDKKRLKKEYPDIYEKFKKDSTSYKRFSVKKKK